MTRSVKTHFLWLPGLVLLALLVTSCQSALPGSTLEQQAQPGEVLFTDDFSSPLGGWGIWTRDGALVAYHNGGLRIQVNDVQYDFWSVAGKNYQDTLIEVDATRIGGPADNDYGVICRYQDKENFYMLVVSSDGYYGIAKIKSGQYSMIGSEQLQYSGSLLSEVSSTRLRAVCQGDALRLYANDQMLMEARDSDFASGDVGVLAGAYGEPGVDILFDNFVVKKP